MTKEKKDFFEDINGPKCYYLDRCSSKGIKCNNCTRNTNRKKDYYEPYTWPKPYTTPITVTPKYPYTCTYTTTDNTNEHTWYIVK